MKLQIVSAIIILGLFINIEFTQASQYTAACTAKLKNGTIGRKKKSDSGTFDDTVAPAKLPTLGFDFRRGGEWFHIAMEGDDAETWSLKVSGHGKAIRKSKLDPSIPYKVGPLFPGDQEKEIFNSGGLKILCSLN
jgi:hypothetical protein